MPHTLLLNTTVFTFKGLPLGSYTLMPAPTPPFKAISELFCWSGLQSCHRISLKVLNVIKISSFQNFFDLQVKKEVIGGKVRWIWRVVYQSYLFPGQKLCRDSAVCPGALSWCMSNELLGNSCYFFTQPLQHSQIVHLVVNWLSWWYKFIVKNPSDIKKGYQQRFDFWFWLMELFHHL